MMANILIVDDEPSIRISLREFLKDGDHEVSVAEDVDEALRMLADEDFDVVLADIIMPRITGIDLLNTIKESSPHIQVILMTGEPTVETASVAVRRGAVDYLSKPFSKEKLLRSVAIAAGKKALDDERRRLVEENRLHQENLEQLVAERTGALRDSEERYRSLTDDVLDTSSVGIFILDADFHVVWVNQAIERYFGLHRARVIGKDKRRLVRERIRGIFEDPQAFAKRVLATYDDNTYVEDFECHVLPDGEREDRWLEHRSQPIRSGLYAGGRIESYYDITERKGAEDDRKRLEERLRHTQKMESLGQLAAGVAHDFNNLLVGILGNAELLLTERAEELSSAAKEGLRGIRKSGEKAAKLTHQLLAFCRKEVAKPTLFDLNGLVADVGTTLRTLIGEHITLTVDPSDGACVILGNVGEIEQVIMNLVINARDAMPEGGVVALKIADTALGEADDSANRQAHAGPYIVLTVADTGCGMSRHIKERIFEPFFTTKAAGMGTGLGLSTVYGTIARAGGTITVDSEPGKGTIFRAYFPRTEGAVMSPETERLRTEGSGPGGDETILVCEDDEMVRRLVSATLSSRGYAVLAAEHGKEALELASAHADPISLLLTDVVMPGMNGQELADTLVDRIPGLKVIYMSGYTGNVLTSRSGVGGHVEFIEKPFLPSDLLRRVRAVLDTKEENR